MNDSSKTIVTNQGDRPDQATLDGLELRLEAVVEVGHPTAVVQHPGTGDLYVSGAEGPIVRVPADGTGQETVADFGSQISTQGESGLLDIAFNAGGDLFLEGGSVAREIVLLRRPTQPHRFERGRGALWRLISHLSLNHLSLSAGGIDAIREMLRLYDLPRSAVTRRQIEALVAIDFKPATAWLPGQPFPTFVRQRSRIRNWSA